MARVAFPLVLQSPSSGSAIAGATATITKHVIGGSLGSGAAASIYVDESTSTPLPSNQIVSDNRGRWTQGAGAGYAQYWLPEGTYDVAVSGTGLTGYSITRELVSGEHFSQSDQAFLAVGLTPVIHSSSATVDPGSLAIFGPAGPYTATLPTGVPNGTVCAVQAGRNTTYSLATTVSAAAGILLPGFGSTVTSFLLGAPLSTAILVWDQADSLWRVASGGHDSGWTPFTVQSNWTAGVIDVSTPAARLINDRVFFRGAVRNNTGGPSALNTSLPLATMKPAVTVVLGSCFLGTPSATYVEVSSLGNVLGPSVANGAEILLQGLNYSVT